MLHAFLLAVPPIDLEHVALHVVLEATSIRQTTTLHASAPDGPSPWTLQLQPTLAVRSVTSGGSAIGHEIHGGELRLDLSSVERDPDGSFEVTIEAEGAPAETFSKDHGGYVRSVVAEDLAYVRSQVPWYPRPPEDAATYTITIDAPEAWQVRSAGELSAKSAADGRASWTFEQRRPVRTVGLAAGPWTLREREIDGAVFDALVFPGNEAGADVLLEVAARAFAHHATQFGDVPRARFTLVEMPEAFGAGSGYGEEGYILIGTGAFRAPGAPWAQDLIAHEVAHTWWGREVSFRDFANEMLATYAELRFAEADRGAAAARAKRREAIDAVAKAGGEGRAVALSDIRGWGGGMNPETYRAHAYDKGSMLLSMLEDALGRRVLDRALAKLFADRRGATMGYEDLRAALVAAGRDARAIVERLESPGIPLVTVEHEVSRSGSKWRVEGTLVLEGDPIAASLTVAAVDDGGGEQVEKRLALRGSHTKFQLTAPFEPSAVVVDPDYRVLAARSHPTIKDPEALFSEAFKVVNSPNDGDVSRNEHAIRLLRALLRARVASNEGLCHGGIGRCLFRLGRNAEAETELTEALRLLGDSQPFHRAWFHLRLGCIADLAGRREEALKHYDQASGPGASDATVERANRYKEKPYRGFEQDG